MAREVVYDSARVFRDKLRCIVEATEDGVVHTTHVTEILLRDGQSKSSKPNLRGTVQNFLRKDHDYEYVGPGTYQYLPMAGLGHDYPSGSGLCVRVPVSSAAARLVPQLRFATRADRRVCGRPTDPDPFVLATLAPEAWN